MSVERRYERQARLPEIGEEGCARIQRSEAEIGGAGLEGEVEERYLVGAGVLRARRGSAARPSFTPFDVRDESARAVASGAYRALATLRRALGMASG
jgi:molybdopterin/thiamine biosynthesis adenylyltransferase